ncbi:MAG: hypothetical protein ACUVX1_16690 [Chloroflexota bacterium]
MRYNERETILFPPDSWLFRPITRPRRVGNVAIADCVAESITKAAVGAPAKEPVSTLASRPGIRGRGTRGPGGGSAVSIRASTVDMVIAAQIPPAVPEPGSLLLTIDLAGLGGFVGLISLISRRSKE